MSAFGWSYVLVCTLIHVFNLDSPDAATTNVTDQAKTTFDRIIQFILSFLPFFPKPRTVIIKEQLHSNLPGALGPYLERAASTFSRVGPQTAFVQSFAALEVLHVLLGLVRSPLVTTTMQVASRLWLIWGIADRYEAVSGLCYFVLYDGR
jgi:very-long-chain (3R)-3-hydroxyacyl-CoA dehydratase